MRFGKFPVLWLLFTFFLSSSVVRAQTAVPSQYKDVSGDLVIPTEEQLLKDDPDPVVLSAQIAVRLKKIQRSIPLDYNDHVQTYISYNTKRKTHIAKMLGRAKKFFPVFEPILAEYGIPDEMKYLAVVESALNPFAVSPMGASGPWQFMYSTGLRYNLTINKRIDERRDPYKSCESAARYLKEMYNLYGNWHLAIASYNCGPGNVNKAIKKAGGSKNFWDIRPYLPAETRAYVPSFIAIVYAMKYAPQYGIVPLQIDREPTERITTRAKITVNALEKILEIPRQIIIDENPSLLTTMIPANFTLNLPSSKILFFTQYQDSLYQNAESVTVAQKLVVPTVVKPSTSSKETTKEPAPEITAQKDEFSNTPVVKEKTAKNQKTKSKELPAAAEKTVQKSVQVKPAKSPVKGIKPPETKKEKIENPDFIKEDDENYKVVVYTVKKGDNLGYISSWFHCKVKEIRRWNDINGNLIDVNDELLIYVHNNDYAKFVRLNYLSNRLKDLLSSKIQTEEEKDALKKKEQLQDSLPLTEKINPVKLLTKRKDCFLTYKVRSGENLWLIAQKYDDVTVQDLMQWNGFKKTPVLHKGDELKVRKIPCE
jgi:membrane-bound lytic murein transglycosylase D